MASGEGLSTIGWIACIVIPLIGFIIWISADNDQKKSDGFKACCIGCLLVVALPFLLLFALGTSLWLI